jgi:hypothetical protein
MTPASTSRVIGSTSVKAARPKNGSSAYRISSVPYAADESPSQDSTPSASGLDSRWFFSCSVTSGGPSARRFTEYQNPSGSSAPVMSAAVIWSSSWPDT